MPGRYFAYGKDTIGDCECPAVRAGFSPGTGDKTTAPAEWYDGVVRDLGFSSPHSTIEEEKAKTAWLKTIEQLKGRYHEDSEVVRAAEEVAEDLGWL